MRFRQSLILYAQKYGVTNAAVHYRTNRQYIYRWMKRYDGTIHSLADRSRRPHHHPNEHTPQELKLIRDMRRRNPHDGLVVFWVKLRQRGYTRSISGLYRILIKTKQIPKKLPNPKYIPKPYQQMSYPGQKVQIDVKFVPRSCLVGEAAEEGGYYQYTFIDEYSRFRYLKAFKEHSSYSSTQFLIHCIKKFPFSIECVQTDNGPEFTNRLIKNTNKLTLFEKTMMIHGIQYHPIKPYTPRHNGKVERSHRKDNEEFYASHKFFSFEDFAKQLARRERQYNNFPMRPLHWQSPKHVLSSFPISVTHH